MLSYFINPYGYSFITNIIGSVAAFMFFEKWDIGSNRILNSVSAATFDVYFVHSDFNTSRLFIYYILGARFVVDSPWMILHVIIVIIAMWLLGLAVYYVRKALFSLTVDRLLDKIKFISKKTEI